jgi:hypothetical protein
MSWFYLLTQVYNIPICRLSAASSVYALSCYQCAGKENCAEGSCSVSAENPAGMCISSAIIFKWEISFLSGIDFDTYFPYRHFWNLVSNQKKIKWSKFEIRDLPFETMSSLNMTFVWWCVAVLYERNGEWWPWVQMN